MESVQIPNNGELDSNEELKALEKLNRRREARRRKILENAKNRLEKLNGRTGAANTSTAAAFNTHLDVEHHGHEKIEGPIHFDNAEFSDPEVEPDIIPQQLIQNDTPLDINNIFSALNTETASPQQKRHILLRARFHLILSALVSCIYTFVLCESTTSSFSIFIPAGLCVIIDLLFFREQQPLNPAINLVITLCNIRLPSQTKNILHLFSIIQNLIVDLGVFMFSFCIFTCSLVYIKNPTDLIIIK